MSNPYAPPVAATFTVPETALPDGMRRFRLAPAPTKTLVRRALYGRHAVVGVLYAMAIALLAALGLSVAITAGVMVLFWLVSGATLFLRQRVAIERQIATFEVLLAPRVVRRVMVGMVPAEILRPEVSRVVETPRGLWLVCSAPRRSLALVKAIDGYPGLRDTLAGWRPIETVRGWEGFAFGYRQRRHMGRRDRIDGTVLASDASLATELATVRGVSADRGMGFGPVATMRRRLVRMAILWALLVLLFLAIWQFLQPAERRPSRPRPPVLGPAPTSAPSMGIEPPLR